MSPNYFLRSERYSKKEQRDYFVWWGADGPTEDASAAKPFRSKYAAEQFARESISDHPVWKAVPENTETW